MVRGNKFKPKAAVPSPEQQEQGISRAKPDLEAGLVVAAGGLPAQPSLPATTASEPAPAKKRKRKGESKLQPGPDGTAAAMPSPHGIATTKQPKHGPAGASLDSPSDAVGKAGGGASHPKSTSSGAARKAKARQRRAEAAVAAALEDAAALASSAQRLKGAAVTNNHVQLSAGINASAKPSLREEGRAKVKRKHANGGSTAVQAVVPSTQTSAAALPQLSVPTSTAGAGSNWEALKAALAAQHELQPQRRGGKKLRAGGADSKGGGKGSRGGGGADDPTQDAKPAGVAPRSKGAEQGLTKVLAIDCEMVGVGPDGLKSVLARVCIVNSAGNVVLDTYCRPLEKVTDYRTKVSGVRPHHLESAPDFASVQKQVVDAVRGRVLVGHALQNDLEALMVGHPRKDIRDTARYPPLMQGGGKLRPRALRHLALEHLGLSIQMGEHSPLDDARAALYLYLKYRKGWEKWLAAGGKPPKTEYDAPSRKKAAPPLAAGGCRGLQPPPSRAAAMLTTLEQLAKKAEYMADL